MFFLRLNTRAFHSRPAAVNKVVAKPSKIYLQKLNLEPDTAFIRIGGKHEFLKSPAEAFALIRDVERRFGPVQSFQFKRDFDKETCYQAFAHVAFKDPAVYQHLPTTPTEFTFKCLSVESDKPGGVGLEDLKPFLETQLPEQTSDFYQSPESEGSTSGDTISYTMTGCRSNLIIQSMYTKTADVAINQAAPFLEWGGFHSLKPISSETELRIENVFRPSSIDQLRMRCALRWYSEEASLPNPYEVLPGQELETAQKQESIEASDPVSALQGSTIPSDVLTSELSASSSSSNAPQREPPPSSTTPTMSASSTFSKPYRTPPRDRTPPSSTLKSLLPQPEASAQEFVTSRVSSPTQLSKTSTSAIDDIHALAAQMQKLAKNLKKAKKRKEQRKIKMEANPLPKLSREKLGSSSRDVIKQVLAQKASDAKRQKQENPKTISQKISSFFSGLF